MTVTFGFPEFWETAFRECREFFEAGDRLQALADSVFAASVEKAETRLEKVIYALARSTANTFTEVVTLVGNGSGLGAMRLTRGMFEGCVAIEYLRRNPSEVDNYFDYGYVLQWKRYQQLLESSPSYAAKVSPEGVNELQIQYNRVRPRFEDKKGRVRAHWHSKSIFEMAAEVGMKEQYELLYSLTASMHHSNAEGLFAQIRIEDAGAIIQQPPSTRWLREVLIAGHIYLLQALDTLNEALKLGFDEQLSLAEADCHKIWNDPPSSP